MLSSPALPEWFEIAWPYVSTVLILGASLWASGHAILHKREVRASIGWVSVIWLAPAMGAFLYWLLGINRIRRRAVALRATTRRYHVPMAVEPLDGHASHRDDPLIGALDPLVSLIDQVTPRPLLPGNEVTPLFNGDEAYPAMLKAIDEAQHSVSLSTYIFDNDPAGKQFVEALTRAHERGVEVRVLIDDTGARYSVRPIDHSLRRRGVKVARFMPALRPRRVPYFNLRNHRKIMVVDGRIGFTGGMNIRAGHVLSDRPSHPVADTHFRVEGPVSSQLQEVFAEDWEYSTKEALVGEAWFPAATPVGTTVARGIADGPDEYLDQIRWTLLGALGCAQKSVAVMTPYFLPDVALATALNIAAMRGVQVDVIVPRRSNLRVVQWATWAHLGQVLGRGCRVWMTPPPFDHSKLMVVDGRWVLVGSANWDPRSLRLNFELNVECYDPRLAEQLEQFIERRKIESEEVTRGDLDRRPLSLRLRDGVARLLTPYL